MNRLLLAAFCLLLAACAPPSPMQGGAGVRVEPTFGAAGQSVILTATSQSLQATGIVLAAQQAQATAEAQKTRDAFDGVALAATAQSIQLTGTAQYDQATQQAEDTRIASTEIAFGKTATPAAVATAQHATDMQATQATQFQQQQSADNANAGRTIGIVLALSVLVLFGSFAIGKFFWDDQQRKIESERQQQERDLDRQRQMVIIMLAGLKTTPYGLIFTDPQTLRPQLIPPSEPTTLLHGKTPLPESEVGEVGHLIINDGDTSHVVPRLTPEEEAARQRMITFIEAAIAYWNRVGLNGPSRNQIPSTHRYAKHNLSPWNSSAEWQAHRNLFGPNFISTSAGTYCPTQYPTLGELREAVRQGRIPVCLPVKQPVP